MGESPSPQRQATATKKPAIPKRSASGAQLQQTNIPGVYTFQPSEKRIDHLKSDVKQLRRHGIPPRPKGKGKGIEAAARVWDRMVSKKFRHIPPILDVAPRRSQLSPRQKKSKSGISNSDINNNNIWSGGALQAVGAEKLLSAWAHWVIPFVNRPSGAPDSDGPWKSSAWVGLDGWGNSDVLQAGTEHDVTPGTDWGDQVSYYAWYEWFPLDSMRFVNFPVTPGDAIFCFIHFDGPDANQVIYGLVRLLNLTNGTETSAYIAMPGPVALPGGFLGQTAECIMERPSFRLPDGTLVPFNIPHYGEVTFTDFGACSDQGNAYTALNLTTIGLMSGDSSGERGEAIVCRPV